MLIRRRRAFTFLALGLSAFLLWRLYSPGALSTTQVPLSSPALSVLEPIAADLGRNSKDGSILVRVPSGPFLIGSEDSQAFVDEAPLHKVDMEEFWIGKHAVTNEQFDRFVSLTGYQAGTDWRDPGAQLGPRAPVVQVSWKDALAYCTWAGLRLPTEAEWEKAARGTDGRKFPWGNQWEPDRAWFFENSEGRIHPVDSRPQGASPYGCLNLAGNIWEWTSSVYRPYPYNPSDGREDPESPEPRISRGGAWYTYSRSLRCSRRCPEIPTVRSNSFGFRVATSAGPP